MGKKSGVKKNTNSNGETTSIPTSSSASSMEMSDGSNHTTESEIEGGNDSKKMKREVSSNSPGQVEAGPRSEAKEVLMEHLPPEMLTNILQCVDDQNLFKCRLVNRKWCLISSGILTRRPDADIYFKLNSISQFVLENGQRSLKQFLITMKKTKNNPYSRFTFAMTEKSSQSQVFEQEDFRDFLSDFASSNQRIKSLTFDCGDVESVEKLQFFTAKLGDLLLNKIPCLEELYLFFPHTTETSVVKLFRTPKQFQNQDQVQFPAQLKVIHFTTAMISTYPEIVKDLLSAAVNLSWFRASITNSEDLHVLHSLGKLHLLREADIDIDRKFFSTNQYDNNPVPLPKLKYLDLVMILKRADETVLPPATIFLTSLFESCKDTLNDLSIAPLGKLPNLEFLTFKNLRKLCISEFQQMDWYYAEQIFPPGIRSRDVFPAVTELDFRKMQSWSAAFPQEDSIPILRRVTSLNLEDNAITADTFPVLAAMCPNLTKIKIEQHEKDDNEDDGFDEFDNEYDEYRVKPAPSLNFLLIGSSIWSNMKELESLEVDINVDDAAHFPACLDSCFTGISVENCFRLYEITKTGHRSKNSQKGKFLAKIEELAVRIRPSILDMKDLKRLIINPYLGGKLMDNKKEFFTKKLTWVSQEFAFKLVPHLKLNED